MAQQTIRFRIRPDGRVEELVEGLAGLACEQLTSRIEAQLGVVQRRERTSEAYAVSSASVASKLSQAQQIGAQQHLAPAVIPDSGPTLNPNPAL